MAEWSIAPVLKTDVLKGTGGSNPSLSAESDLKSRFFLFIGIQNLFTYKLWRLKQTNKQRVDYIDLIKGITIFGVIWVHTCHFDWLTAILVNSIFFFLSGFFFYRKPIKNFIKTKIKTILIPFLFFYLLSYPFRIIVHYWDYRTLSTFDWRCILDIFDISAQTDYLFVNVPLWFLICIFVIQVIYYFISYLDKRLIAVIAIACLVAKDLFYSIPSPFMINAAFYYLGFFALGNLFGKPLIEKLKNPQFRHISLRISILLMIIVIGVSINSTNNWIELQTTHIKLLMIFFTLMSVASYFNENKHLRLIRFFGENSLIIMGLHVPPLIVIKRISMMLFGECTPMMGFLHSILCIAILYVVIIFCNKYIPFLVGKSK